MTTITNITAAGLLGVSTRTINRLVQNGTIQAPSPRRGQRTTTGLPEELGIQGNIDFGILKALKEEEPK